MQQRNTYYIQIGLKRYGMYYNAGGNPGNTVELINLQEVSNHIIFDEKIENKIKI